jgi:hypothetical protein
MKKPRLVLIALALLIGAASAAGTRPPAGAGPTLIEKLTRGAF